MGKVTWEMICTINEKTENDPEKLRLVIQYWQEKAEKLQKDLDEINPKSLDGLVG